MKKIICMVPDCSHCCTEERCRAGGSATVVTGETVIQTESLQELAEEMGGHRGTRE
jgi:hypothetical protein